jgi:DNA repair ATPase RecN
MDFQQDMHGALSGLERLATKIPGYRGYKEKESRREADRLLRQHLVAQLDEERRRLTEIQRRMLDSGGLRMLDDVDRVLIKVQKLSDTIRTASYGYAGLFDAIKVKEAQLDALYQFDNEMVEKVGAIREAVKALVAAQDANTDLRPAIDQVLAAAEEANRHWRERENVITAKPDASE